VSAAARVAARCVRPGGWPLGAAMLLLAAAPAFAGGTASIALSPQRLPLGEVAQLTIEVSRSDLGSFHLEWPRLQLDNFEIVGGPAQRESMSWVNGDLSRTLGMTWYLAPQHAGRARVYGVKLLIDGKPIALPDQEALVDPAASVPAGGVGTPAPADQEPQGGIGASGGPLPGDPYHLFPDLFRRTLPSERALDPMVLLRAELTPANPWAGQQLLYTLYLLVERRPMGEGRLSVETIFPRRVPAFRGFWSQEIPLADSPHPEIVQLGDRLFWRQPILQRALFPFEPGPHTIESAEADLRLVYFRPLGFGLGEEPIRPDTLRRDSNELHVQVQPLPVAPAGFHGAVGQLQAKAQLGQPHVRAGEGVALTEELTGGGNLSGLPDPVLPPLPGVQVSPPQESTQQKLDGTRVVSTRTWVWTLVPERAGQWRIPPLRFVVFDPTSGTYDTLATSEQTLVAGPAAPPPPPPRAASRSAHETPSGWRQPALWAVGGAGAALLLLALGWLIARLRRGDAGARRRLVADVTAALGNGHQPRQAASAAEDAWRSFLGDRYALPAGTPPQQWPRILASHGLQPALAGDLVRLVDDLHYLRYAPQLASTDALKRELLDRSRRLARRLA